MGAWSQALVEFRGGELSATDRITDLVTSYLWRQGGDRWSGSHPDLVQEILMTLLEHGPSSDQDGAVVAFIRTTTQRRLVDWIRKEQGRRRADGEASSGASGWRRSVPLEAASDVAAPDGEWEIRRDPGLRRAVAALGERERSVLRAKFGGQMTDREGAEASGLSLSSYQRACREALAQLGRALAPDANQVKDISDLHRPVQ